MLGCRRPLPVKFGAMRRQILVETSVLAALAMREPSSSVASSSVAHTRALRYYCVREFEPRGVESALPGVSATTEQAWASGGRDESNEFISEQEACRQGAEQSY
jgi:hypothetical protein